MSNQRALAACFVKGENREKNRKVLSVLPKCNYSFFRIISFGYNCINYCTKIYANCTIFWTQELSL